MKNIITTESLINAYPANWLEVDSLNYRIIGAEEGEDYSVELMQNSEEAYIRATGVCTKVDTHKELIEQIEYYYVIDSMMIKPSIIVTHSHDSMVSIIEIDNSYEGLFNIISSLQEKYNEEKEEYRGKVGITVGDDQTKVECNIDWGDISSAIESSKDSGGHEQYSLARISFSGEYFLGTKYFVF
jgi:hypothetical protein